MCVRTDENPEVFVLCGFYRPGANAIGETRKNSEKWRLATFSTVSPPQNAAVLLLFCDLSVGYIRKQSDCSCAFDCLCELALMLCAYSGHAAGHYLAALGCMLTKPCNVFVIDMVDLIYTKAANLTPGLALAGSHLAFFHFVLLSFTARQMNSYAVHMSIVVSEGQSRVVIKVRKAIGRVEYRRLFGSECVA